MSTLPPSAALALAARLLEAEGFAIVARNERGDSLYLALSKSPWHLRLSNHARTAKQRARRNDILTSLIIDAPRSPDQVHTLVLGALKNFSAALTLREAQASTSASGSRK
ncbi:MULTISPECIES: hypothetical protein [Methylobacterium]|uniref:hypothetical protein n=1 Tax=Methylobacterium TaxID=407 RepID=UPI0011CC98D3|nr:MULTISPECIES: hypothetical protein [Methylobacterium]TXN48068.1 hypothetical protein FV233_02585 [Methylobacterium sp. WL7]TXN75563.1 hypothetical protein FV228_03380 [Methylobacterium sp. WL18]GJE22433.1 hypothetical protein JHFBIEKO_2887 [Methylobacterium mesophilicum]